jgi:penicillin amidase
MKQNYLYAAVALWLAACGGSSSPLPTTPDLGTSPLPPTPQGLVVKAVTVLPPGQSGFVSAQGQGNGQASGRPADYGKHLDDQRLLYWGFKFKDGFDRKKGTPLVPKTGIQIYFDDFGVPAVYANSVSDTWYGVGYVAAQQRMFLLDAARRLGRGTLGELTGCSAVPADLQTRVVTYTEAEYTGFFNGLTQDSKDSVTGMVAGINAYIDVMTSNPSLLPAEYQLLSTTPAKFTINDILAEGVLISRSVAAEGANEFLNIKLLQNLESRYGKAEGRKAFLDLVWDDDPKAITTVPVADATFSSQDFPVAGKEANFQTQADFMTALPDTLWKGQGTGNAPAPSPCTPGLPTPVAASPLGGGKTQAAAKLSKSQAKEAQKRVLAAVESMKKFKINRGSFALAINRSKSKDGGALLVSEPQLGYSYPTQLWEIEIHGAGYDARGVTVPGLPVVGIGYTNKLAWALTTGYSKTIDSFIETTCSTAQIAANTCKKNQYFHQNQWKDMSCRMETVRYRPSSNGLPAGTANLGQTYEICRTVHGPIVARDDSKGMARSVAYFMWNRELDNIEGVREWARAKNLAEFEAATAKVSWNENVMVATAEGDIAYFHPGYYPKRHAEADQRFPAKGTGEQDWVGVVPFKQMPRSINPPQGYLANWNNKPAVGWDDGEGLGSTSRPGGSNQRVSSLLDRLSTSNAWTFSGIQKLEADAGISDHRYREYRPLLQDLRNATLSNPLTPNEIAVLDLMLNWDGIAFGPNASIEDVNAKDGPAATLFGEWVGAVREMLFNDLKAVDIDPSSVEYKTAFTRLVSTGSHVYDHGPLDNLAVRILRPGRSGLAVRRSFHPDQSQPLLITRQALQTAMSNARVAYSGCMPVNSTDFSKCTRVHARSNIRSLTGVIGPSTTMPYFDRGSWIHVWGVEKP